MKSRWKPTLELVEFDGSTLLAQGKCMEVRALLAIINIHKQMHTLQIHRFSAAYLFVAIGYVAVVLDFFICGGSNSGGKTCLDTLVHLVPGMR